MGKKLPKETIRVVESFYQDDEFTRQMPGRKDYVSIARNVHVQKILILFNLKELFAEFKIKFPSLKVCIVVRLDNLIVRIIQIYRSNLNIFM